MTETKQDRIRKHREKWQSRQKTKMEGVTKRTNERASRSSSQQLEVLDSRLGKGVGAKKERKKLAKKKTE